MFRHCVLLISFHDWILPKVLIPKKAALAGWKKVVNGSLFFHCIFFCVHLMMSGRLPPVFVIQSVSLRLFFGLPLSLSVCVCVCVRVRERERVRVRVRVSDSLPKMA